MISASIPTFDQIPALEPDMLTAPPAGCGCSCCAEGSPCGHRPYLCCDHD